MNTYLHILRSQTGRLYPKRSSWGAFRHEARQPGQGGINSVVGGTDNSEISNDWIARNIQQGHGPLGAAYPDAAWGMEGDTPAFLGLIPNGLNVAEHPNWGGWGGRYRQCLYGFSRGFILDKALRPVPVRPAPVRS